MEEPRRISREQIAFGGKPKSFHGARRLRYGFLYFNYRVSSYQLSACQSIDRPDLCVEIPPHVKVRRASAAPNLNAKVIERPADEHARANLDCFESSIVLSTDKYLNVYVRTESSIT